MLLYLLYWDLPIGAILVIMAFGYTCSLVGANAVCGNARNLTFPP